MKLKAFVSRILIAAGCLTPSLAQTYPDRYVTVVAPFPPGGASDTSIRIMQAKLTEFLGQPVVIENRPGGTGSIGMTAVARAAPDGYTIVISSVGAFAVNPAVNKKLSYDPLRDFDLLTLAVQTPIVLVVNPKLPVNSVKELIEYQKKNPGELAFGSSGLASGEHLTTELFWQQTKTTGVHVPYRGSGPAITDAIAGHVQGLFTNFGLVSQQIQSGQLKALAVSTEKRLPDYPNIPTLAESGIDDMVVMVWQGMAAPKNLPPAVKEKLHSAIVKCLNDPGVKKAFAEIGFETVGGTPEAFAQYLKREIDRWSAVAKAANIQTE
jgi:tripartite-type tricarboxylate transporter receptor subunit TctC